MMRSEGKGGREGQSNYPLWTRIIETGFRPIASAKGQNKIFSSLHTCDIVHRLSHMQTFPHIFPSSSSENSSVEKKRGNFDTVENLTLA